MADQVGVCFTMDCERVASESPSPAGGPVTWDLSERAIRGYAERLLAAGYPPTLFATPECAAHHANLFHDLETSGAEVGMHLHAQSLADHRYDRCLGEYPLDTQREILGLAVSIWADAMGRAPRAFRGGNASASDGTFALVSELGFTHSSTSYPGRDLPHYGAVWTGAKTGAHWTNATDRLRAGDLPLLEFPLSSDPSHVRPNGLPYELRIESGGFAECQESILESILARMAQEREPFPMLVILTHNCWDYTDRAVAESATLEGYLAHFGQQNGPSAFVGLSLEDARGAYLQSGVR